MRLSKIKLAGFKSFVDPTTIPLPSNLIGVVGPNGCGKSNVIDAVRWVMGESSAKNLRGDSMADVIFNGSNTRKPVGQASIELIFDNSDGTLGGQYAQYSEISIKRMVSRDGQSQYYQNGTRCRRRDITDIFLGTGLGPRSYSIIEQGMISRLIEARPEDLRVFLEEAAGISKYKERRKETETRIRHTRENMERLTDLREELAKQLDKLQRQSRTAEKYKILKEEERLLKAQLTALRWQGLDRQIQAKQEQIGETRNRYEAVIAKLRSIEADIEKQRDQHLEASEEFNEIQASYYSVGSEIARVEQSIAHTKERKTQNEQDLKTAEESWYEASAHIKTDLTRIEELSAALEENQPALELAREKESNSAAELADAEQAMNTWQAQWEDFNNKAAEPAQKAEVERTRIAHLEQQILRALDTLKRLEIELESLVPDALAMEIEQLNSEQEINTARCDEMQHQLHEQLNQISEQRERNVELDRQLNERRGKLQSLQGRQSSLEALQQAALGKQEGVVTSWLEQNGLGQAQRLAQSLDVQVGWEKAVECVLGFNLEAVCIDGLNSVSDILSSFENGSLALFDTAVTVEPAASNSELGESLLSKISSPWNVNTLMPGVYCVEDLSSALALRPRLLDHQSLICRDGVWVGKGWLRLLKESDEKQGVIQREQELANLNENIQVLEAQIEQLQSDLQQGRDSLHSMEEQREALQNEHNQANQLKAQVQSKLGGKQARYDQVVQRRETILAEVKELKTHNLKSEQETEAARGSLDGAIRMMEEFAQQRELLEASKDELRRRLDDTRSVARHDRDVAHDIAMKIQTMRTELNSTEQNQQRMDKQLEQLTARREELQRQIEESEAPLQQMAEELQDFLNRRVDVEAQLTAARRGVEELDHSMRALASERHEVEQGSESIRQEMDLMRMAQQEQKVRRQTLEESLQETGHDLATLCEQMPPEAEETLWQEKVDKMAQRVQRLGPINLAAIEEYQQQLERKEYLDAQFDDLSEALLTLENAIKKIDRETRSRFKETYEKVNEGFKELFPRLFGGGQSYLELTGEDLLDTGVTVMARPPGKRNSSIHLLSGGEKALTAVALVFSIFQLNPAPFCMLDEVDAPLDDANVGRFCNMVKEMSEHVQFIFITHNKITMEMANQLNGVTMHEPGVSRIVAVDVDEAYDMAVG
ncbi:MAG: chromosome segregation protein SMC [Gammaproteobacteria bacterium]|nr:chromosome segregation protein SMC [Gammaproteobacteria bacterium]MDH5800188.1 chromosome segregation protein SMC [Gammaproteobacteria bacterium]